MAARITRKDGWVTVENFHQGEVIGVERCRTREWIERRNAVRAAVAAAAVLVGGLAVMTARAEPGAGSAEYVGGVEIIRLGEWEIIWRGPLFSWPLIWIRNIDAGSIG
jgi:hypothetical protein